MITLIELKNILKYDPDTGIFLNQIQRANCVQVGMESGFINKKGYRVIKINNKAYKAHKLAVFYVTEEWPDQVDHINGDKADNRYVNLRPSDYFVNAQNKHQGQKDSASGLIGAHRGGWKGRRWVSDIRHNGQRTYLGIFATAQEAHEAYLRAKRALHQGCTI